MCCVRRQRSSSGRRAGSLLARRAFIGGPCRSVALAGVHWSAGSPRSSFFASLGACSTSSSWRGFSLTRLRGMFDGDRFSGLGGSRGCAAAIRRQTWTSAGGCGILERLASSPLSTGSRWTDGSSEWSASRPLIGRFMCVCVLYDSHWSTL